MTSQKIEEEKNVIKSLISDISHQTKTPIANIMLYSSLLMEQDNISDDTRNMIEQVNLQSQKLDFLIEALITASRLETGIISVNPIKNSISELVDNILIQIESKSKAKNIDITTNIEKGYAIFDMKWTVEAIYNIVDNAVKYTQNGGSVKIIAIPYELFYRIDIIDNGIGIEDKDLCKIFQRFYRSQNVQQIEGVGIGLYLTREIISSEGGYIKVASKINEDTTFSVFLPK
ncbi:MAG TPA: two-component sensor histidine kinase [Clostridiales bacterium]|nr:two-component sensor histidine kinase [Clostridiales bacterium]